MTATETRRRSPHWRVLLTLAWWWAICGVARVELTPDAVASSTYFTAATQPSPWLPLPVTVMTTAFVAWSATVPLFIRLGVVVGSVGFLWTCWAAFTDMTSIALLTLTLVVHVTWLTMEPRFTDVFRRIAAHG